jgi:hypothetical protein
MTIDLLLSRIRSKAIDLEPDFQRRRGIWNDRQQSRLIESLLLRIPLPTQTSLDSLTRHADGASRCIQRRRRATSQKNPCPLDAACRFRMRARNPFEIGNSCSVNASSIKRRGAATTFSPASVSLKGYIVAGLCRWNPIHTCGLKNRCTRKASMSVSRPRQAPRFHRGRGSYGRAG